ncbi:MAG: HYR domain-containing protein, partial [Cyclobacteriaceae bacterium]|nr:HYR domain-containing protein [Cyclobacteriaceae bacterium]
FALNLADNVAPIMNCTPSAPISIVGGNIGDYTGLFTATDNCDSNPAITQSPASGTPATNGMKITITATDATGNSSFCEYTLNITPDTTPPTFTFCPGNQQLTCTDTIIPDYTSMATATDNEDPNPTITQSPVAGSAFVDGMTITMTATDDSGNASDCTFTVNQLTDVTAPVPDLTTLTAITAECSVTTLTPPAATDNCSATVTVTNNATLPITTSGTTTITWTYDDGNGNTATQTQDVIIADVTAPVPDLATLVDIAAECSVTALTAPTATDNCSVTVTNNVTLPITTQGTTTITWTYDDGNGNTTSQTQDVIIADTEDPVINCPANQSLALGATIPDYTGLATATDNCDTSPTITQLPVAGTAFVDGMTITLTATDGTGNSSNCTFIINQLPDTVAPTITFCPGNQQLTCADTVIPDYTSMATATDNEDPNPVVTQNPVVGSAFVDGMTITLTATDASGNTSNCVFIVNMDEVLLVDAGDDVDIIEGESSQLNASSNMSGTYSWSPSFSLDASDIASPIASPKITTTYEVIFTSDGGCVGKDNLTVFVEESEGIYKNKYGVSPDGDGINEVWKIDEIENYPNNRVVIYNRWSDKVYEISGYDNITKVFNGEANRMTSLGAGNLPEGTYYFKIELNQGEEVISGYLVLKR